MVDNKEFKIKIFFFTVSMFFFFLINVTFAGNRYENETKIIEKNTADFIKINQQKIAEFNVLKDAWNQLSNQVKEIGSILSLKVNTVDTKADESIKRLQEINDEKVYVESTIASMSIVRAKINVIAAKIKELIEKYPGIKEANLKNLSIVISNVSIAENTMRERKKKVDVMLEQWMAWQFDIAKKAKEKHQYEIMSESEVIHTLNRINTTFSILKMNFLLALKNSDYEDAENILQGFARLRSVFPLFFSDKITNKNQSQLLKQILNSTEIDQSHMAGLIEKNAKKIVKFKSVSDL